VQRGDEDVRDASETASYPNRRTSETPESATRIAGHPHVYGGLSADELTVPENNPD
jgi:hypothetical protein